MRRFRAFLPVFLLHFCGSGAFADFIDGNTNAYGTAGHANVSVAGVTVKVNSAFYEQGTKFRQIEYFFNTSNDSTVTEHSFLVVVHNFTNQAWTGFQFSVGTIGLNPYLSQDTDGDSIEDYLDSDIDGDGIANADDNAPLRQNPDQTDTDGDGWGDVMDFAPFNATLPGGLPPQGPAMDTSSKLKLSSLPGLTFDTDDFMPPPTSTHFSTLSHEDFLLYWTGGVVAPGQTVTFTFTVDVPTGDDFDGFLIRQAFEADNASAVPEPFSAGLLGLGGFGLCLAYRQRLGKKRHASCSA